MPDSSWDTLELASALEKPRWLLETNSHNKQFFLRDSVAGPGFSKQGFLGVLRNLISGILKSWWANLDITSWGWEIYSDGWNPILDQNGPVPIPTVPFFCPIKGENVMTSYFKFTTNSRGNKRVVLQEGGFGKCTLIPVFCTVVPFFFCCALVPVSGFRRSILLYPRSGFWGPRNIRQNHSFGNTLLQIHNKFRQVLFCPLSEFRLSTLTFTEFLLHDDPDRQEPGALSDQCSLFLETNPIRGHASHAMDV